MNKQIEKDMELLTDFYTNELFQVKRFQDEGAIVNNSTVKSYIDSLLEAQARVTAYETEQKILKLSNQEQNEPTN